MKRTAILKRSPLKRRPWKREQTPDSWRTRYGLCASCNLYGMVEQHHLIPKQVLKRHDLPLWDLRNKISLCQRCHHRHETRHTPLSRHAIPSDAWAYAREVGLSWVLYSRYPAA